MVRRAWFLLKLRAECGVICVVLLHGHAGEIWGVVGASTRIIEKGL